ncbi:ATPase, T2SS/T4P/T4SS family [Citrobacter europaeus]|uniref:Type IV fimbrial assembly, ATPase PilB n=1 Tax=Citrobacter europaeus TaxID=1914243 RepID=A0ABY0JPN5_9ENTR|nr:ATPase, T2SS/T4P/T4SS family [Citrobacter europaeus]SBW25208.1 Type IV fimbrial assembly, ATPase PilB [Citrobacter europaeus]
MNTTQLTALCQRYQGILLDADNEVVHIAVVDAPSHELLDALHFATTRRIDIVCWTRQQMEGHTHTPRNMLPAVVTKSSASAADLLNQTFHSALVQRASDIHIEPAENHYRIRLRVDGVLHALPEVTTEMGIAITARLKVLGSLDIAEHRLAQDGQFTVEISGEPVSFRIATLPCRYGEKVVLRLLHQVDQTLEIAALGMQDAQLGAFSHALQQPQGLILVTGPTGSGKTVTLYSALLRQDPDIIMVGEIRDGETAEIALKAAQTGHLVLSTLHTNSTTETLIRLQQMGVARWMIASALTLVIAQRLVRKLCPHCRQRLETPIALPEAIWPAPLPHWQATGCEHCYQGFYGRTALFEVLPVTPALRQSIANGTSAEEVESDAKQLGMSTLFETGCQAVEQGLTTFEELIRVLGMPHVS